MQLFMSLTHLLYRTYMLVFCQVKKNLVIISKYVSATVIFPRFCLSFFLPLSLFSLIPGKWLKYRKPCRGGGFVLGGVFSEARRRDETPRAHSLGSR